MVHPRTKKSRTARYGQSRRKAAAIVSSTQLEDALGSDNLDRYTAWQRKEVLGKDLLHAVIDPLYMGIFANHLVYAVRADLTIVRQVQIVQRDYPTAVYTGFELTLLVEILSPLVDTAATNNRLSAHRTEGWRELILQIF